MAIEVDSSIVDMIEGKTIVLYTPNANGEMPNAAVKQFIPSSISIGLDKWFVGYTPEIISGYNMVEISEEIASGLQHFSIVDGTTVKYDVNGSLNPDQEKILITMTEDQKAKQIVSKKFVMVLEANRKLDSKLSTFMNQFSTVEQSTWDLQLSEAKAYTADNTVATPILSVLAETRGLTVTDLVTKVLEKAAEYQTMIVGMIGIKQVLESKIQSATTDTELNTLLTDLNNY